MRLLIMFDLPVETSKERREYRQFRKRLINEGFLMIQYSVYVRVCVNKKSAQFIEKRISTFLPETGTIQSMIMKYHPTSYPKDAKVYFVINDYDGKTI